MSRSKFDDWTIERGRIDPAAFPLVEGMRADLAEFRRRLGADPENEMAALLLMALERERIVAVGYRGDQMVERLRRARLSDHLNSVLVHILQQVWKDEEMHARYLHGTLLRQPALGLRLRASLQSMSGVIGGWTTLTQQLDSWRSSPFARAAAEVAVIAGRVGGKIVAGAEEAMHALPLRDYAWFNLDAEWSAVLAYERILELVAETERRGRRLLILPSAFARELEQAVREEAEHARVFGLLHDALTERDTLRDGVDEQDLVSTLERVAEPFTPYTARSAPSVHLGLGGRVAVVEASAPGEKLERFDEALDRGGLRNAVDERAAELGKPVADLTVAVKVDFMLGYSKTDPSTVVDPVLVERLADALARAGTTRVTVVESRNLYDRFYGGRDVASVASYFGFVSDRYRVVDLSQEQEDHDFRRGQSHETVGRTWRDADLRVSFAKLKTHPVERFALSLWNLSTAVSQDGRFLFSDRIAEPCAAIMELLDAFPVHFGVIDAFERCADGIMGAIACPHPKDPLRFYAGRDLLSLDAVAARHMGVEEPRVGSIYDEALYWFGDPRDVIVVDGVDNPILLWREVGSGVRGKVLGPFAKVVYQRFSARGALFAPAMDPERFPPLWRAPVVTVAQALVRRIVGF